jgi:hypothetical protein
MLFGDLPAAYKRQIGPADHIGFPLSCLESGWFCVLTQRYPTPFVIISTKYIGDATMSKGIVIM